MQSNDAYNARLKEWEVHAYSTAELFVSGAPLIFLDNPLTLMIFGYGASDALMRMKTNSGISERIGKGLYSICKSIKEKSIKKL